MKLKTRNHGGKAFPKDFWSFTPDESELMKFTEIALTAVDRLLIWFNSEAPSDEVFSAVSLSSITGIPVGTIKGHKDYLRSNGYATSHNRIGYFGSKKAIQAFHKYLQLSEVKSEKNSRCK